MLKSFAFHIICKCISKLHRRAAKNTPMTTFQLFKLSSPFQETFCNVEKCPKKSHFFSQEKKIEFFRKNLQKQFQREHSMCDFPKSKFFPLQKIYSCNFGAKIQILYFQFSTKIYSCSFG